MSNISGGGKVPGGEPDYLISSAGQQNAGDASKDEQLLQESLGKLKSEEQSTLDKMSAKLGGRRMWGILGAGLIVLLAIGGILLWINPGPPDVNPGPPEGNPGPPDLPNAGGVKSAGACAIHFSSPTEGGAIPLAGQLPVSWSGVPGVETYDLKLVPPASFSVPWLYHVKGTSKNIYMENFPAAGDYELSVSALGPNGQTLCSDVFRFKKAAYDEASGKSKEAGGGGCSSGPGVLVVVCP